MRLAVQTVRCLGCAPAATAERRLDPKLITACSTIPAGTIAASAFTIVLCTQCFMRKAHVEKLSAFTFQAVQAVA